MPNRRRLPHTTGRGFASVRARLMRAALVTAVRVLRRGGSPDPEGPAEELEAHALRLREQMERVGSQVRPGRRVTWHELAGSQGPPAITGGLWVEDRAVVPHADGHASGEDRAVLHLHGGAYLMGSPRTHLGLAASLSRTARAPVVLPAYRLAPEHVFPAALDDAVAAFRWLVEDRRIAPGRIAVTGDSAGGGLGLSLLVRLRDEGHRLPGCYVGMSPWTDLASTGDSMTELDELDPWLSAAMVAPAARAYAGDTPLDDPRLSPLYADLRGLPPMLVHVGSHEILLDDARRLVDRAREARVDASLAVFDEMWHVFQAFPGLPETRSALREIGAFIRRCTASSRVAA